MPNDDPNVPSPSEQPRPEQDREKGVNDGYSFGERRRVDRIAAADWEVRDMLAGAGYRVPTGAELLAAHMAWLRGDIARRETRSKIVIFIISALFVACLSVVVPIIAKKMGLP